MEPPSRRNPVYAYSPLADAGSQGVPMIGSVIGDGICANPDRALLSAGALRVVVTDLDWSLSLRTASEHRDGDRQGQQHNERENGVPDSSSRHGVSPRCSRSSSLGEALTLPASAKSRG